AWNNLGNVYRDNGQQEKALGAYKQAINLKADDEQAYRNLANVYLDLAGDDKDQCTLQEKIVILEGGNISSPDAVIIVEDLIKLYIALSDNTKAQEYLQIREQLLNQ